MKTYFALFFLSFTTLLDAQIPQVNPDKHGFLFGVALGGGALHLMESGHSSTSFSASIPNLKLGYMLNPKCALQLILPGATYTSEGKDRGFEGIVPAVQYWVKDKWWVMGGIGLTLDAPAFYTVKDPATAEFNFGFPAFSAATGYELFQKRRLIIDVQYRLFYGKVDLDNGDIKKGIANMILLGFNWY